MQVEFDAPSTVATAKTASERTELVREDFFKILTSQLQHQDPLNPLDNSEFLNQLVSLQSLEATSKLTDGMGIFMRFQGLASASSMIGKRVVAATDEGDVVRGRVEKVLYDAESKQVRLLVSGRQVRLEGIREVLADPAGGQDEVDDAIDSFDAGQAG